MLQFFPYYLKHGVIFFAFTVKIWKYAILRHFFYVQGKTDTVGVTPW